MGSLRAAGRRYPPGMRPPEIAGMTWAINEALKMSLRLEQLRQMYLENQEWLETAKWNPYTRT